MLRPATAHTLICPQCEQPGPHGHVDQCIAALRKAIAGETPRARPLPQPVPAATKPKAIAPQPVDPLKPLTIAQACELTQVARSTIYNWMREGKIAWEYTAGGSVRIYRASLLKASRADVAR